MKGPAPSTRASGTQQMPLPLPAGHPLWSPTLTHALVSGPLGASSLVAGEARCLCSEDSLPGFKQFPSVFS